MSTQIRRLPDESDKYYSYFSTYVLLGPNRSIDSLSMEIKVSTRHLFRLSKKFNWKERISKHQEEENLQLKSKFAESQKADFHKKLTLLNDNYNLVLKANNSLNYKAYQLLHENIQPERYFKRVSEYLSILLKIQRFEKNFYEEIDNYDIKENFELDDLEDSIERWGDNEMALKKLAEQEKKMSEHLQEDELYRDNINEAEDMALNTKNNTDKNCHPSQLVSDDPEIRLVQERLGIVSGMN